MRWLFRLLNFSWPFPGDKAQSPLELVEAGDLAYRRRDYDEAASLYQKALELANENRQETNYIYSSLAKVYKKSRPDEAYRTSRKALPSPAGFRDCAISLRALAKSARDSGNRAEFREALEELYKLAVRAYLCCGGHDCKTAVSGSMYDYALILHARIMDEQILATYERCGRMSPGGLLTSRGYKLYEEAFGVNERVYEPWLDFQRELAEAQAEVRLALARLPWVSRLPRAEIRRVLAAADAEARRTLPWLR